MARKEEAAAVAAAEGGEVIDLVQPKDEGKGKKGFNPQVPLEQNSPSRVEVDRLGKKIEEVEGYLRSQGKAPAPVAADGRVWAKEEIQAQLKDIRSSLGQAFARRAPAWTGSGTDEDPYRPAPEMAAALLPYLKAAGEKAEARLEKGEAAVKEIGSSAASASTKGNIAIGLGVLAVVLGGTGLVVGMKK